MTKTVRFHELGGPDVLRVEDVETREPGPGELLVRIEAVGLNRAEALFRSGRYIEPVRRFPALLGYEAAGVVERTGDAVDGYETGAPVSVVPAFSMNDYGVYAERAVVPASAVVRRPESVDPVEGAAVWMPYLTAYGALIEQAGMQPGDTVVLTAASSSVGLAAIRVARHIGAVPIATTRGRAKADRLREAGAAAVIVTDEEDVTERVLALTGGAGADVVFDAVAGPGVVALAGALRMGGLLIVYGALSGLETPYPPMTVIRGRGMHTYTLPSTMAVPDRRRRAEAFVGAGLATGAFTATVDRVFGLDDIAEAHRYMEAGAQVGKIVVSTRV